MDGAFRQGGAGRYEITVHQHGRRPDQRQQPDPVTATITALPTGVTVQALYGSGWTCNLAAITTPLAEPADTCYRSDVLAGENGEEPPITVVASVAANAPAIRERDGPGRWRRRRGRPGFGQRGDDCPAGSRPERGQLARGQLRAGRQRGHLHPDRVERGRPERGHHRRAGARPGLGDRQPAVGPDRHRHVRPRLDLRGRLADVLPQGHAGGRLVLSADHADGQDRRQCPGVGHELGHRRRRRDDPGANSSTSAGGQTGADPTTISQSGPAGTPPAPAAPAQLSVSSGHAAGFAQGDAADSYTLKVSDAAAADRPPAWWPSATRCLPG